MLNEVKPNLDLLMSIRLGLAEQYGIPLDVPFRDYKAWYRWTGMEVPTQTMRADFVNQLYSKEGKPCRFEDIFEFERLSKAWLFDEDGLQEWDVDEPRLSDKGLLVEPESTNYLLNTNDLSHNYWDRSTVVSEESTGVGSIKQGGKLTRYMPVSAIADVLATISVGVSDGDFLLTTKRAGGGESSDIVVVGGEVESSINVTRTHSCGGRYGLSREPNETVDPAITSSFRLAANQGTDVTFNLPQWEIGSVMTTGILTDGVPTTRLPETLSTTIPQGHTITGDWDDTLHLFERDGQLDFEGYGYIRTLEIVPIKVKV